MLLLSDANNRFYICNPATRQSLALPALTGGSVAALYHHRPSDEYRVLYWKHLNKRTGKSTDYYILTVGSSEGQRCIGLPVASPSMKSDTIRWPIRARQHPPALLHDCLHWYVNSKIVVFDTLVESFKCMESPIATNSAQLLQLDGALGIGHTQIDGDTMIAELWVLQDYKRDDAWSSKYRIDLPLKVMTQYIRESKFHVQVVSENGDMLVMVRLPVWSYQWSLFYYDCNGELLEEFKRQNVDPMVLGLCFKESLVRHVFFQRKNGCRRWWARRNSASQARRRQDRQTARQRRISFAGRRWKISHRMISSGRALAAAWSPCVRFTLEDFTMIDLTAHNRWPSHAIGNGGESRVGVEIGKGGWSGWFVRGRARFQKSRFLSA
jgi:F-box interacting protein